ncbi:electron transport complex subunit RsxD [Kistimonas asteriae]|uniref:electron transport complex subunit RsxD n=1 Tax=Kistimonas asteriae TaxID=517724 RepID=UPI001BA8C745|nr:electron transport complex subunit RsxD [Kistimonas asteriae]
MALIRQTSPHTLGANRTPNVMQWVLAASLPGLLALSGFFGWGTLINLAWCSLIALAAEAVVLTLRKRPLSFYLKDGSALVTSLLLVLALPPFSPWWLTLTGTVFAIVIGKQLYGGMGYNPFNPAMLGYVLLLISFPQEMTSWAPPTGVEGHPAITGFGDAFRAIFTPASSTLAVDGWTLATPLDIVRENRSLTMPELWESKPQLEGMTGIGWFWVNLAFLAGGLVLLYRKVITWHAPAGMLAGLIVMSLVFWGGSGSESHGSPLLHLFSGATMLGAFFIITDPVSGATSAKGRFIFGLGVGLITYIIRAWGGYPDGVAFATLLMNMAAPTIDYYTQPRTYGHKKPKRGLAKSE